MRFFADKRLKRLLLCILAIAAMSIAVYAVWGSGTTFSPEGDSLHYMVLNDGTVSVYACDKDVTAVTIPCTVKDSENNTYTVTKIGNKAFSGNETLKAVTFADGCQVETIENAFNGCVNLETINWGDSGSLTTIKNAFQGCTSLESLTIPASVEEIGKKAFANCTGLTELTFASGSKLTAIGESAFAYTGKDDTLVPAVIAELKLPASLKILEEDAFHCVPVRKFSLEDQSKLEKIPDGFLAADGADGHPGTKTECYSLWDYIAKWFKDLTSPYPYTPTQVAAACDCLESIDLGDQNALTRIGMGAFKNQTHLTGIDFGEGSVASLTIARGAFVAAGNNGLSGETPGGIDTLVFPANLAELESRAFDYARIKNLAFSENCALKTIPDGFMEVGGNNGRPGAGVDPDALPLYYAAVSLETIDFGTNNRLEYIGAGAFQNQGHLTDISFGTSTADLVIGSGAFIGAGNNGYLVANSVDQTLNEGIETLVFPANLVELGSECYDAYWDYNYTGHGCFDCARVKNVVFSDNGKLTEIPSGFLGLCEYGCNGKPGKKAYDSEEFVNDPVQMASNALETIRLGTNNSLTSISSGAFYNQSHLKSIDFGTSTADLTISSGAFIGAGNNGYLVANGVDVALNEGIETLVFPANLTKLYSAFEYARVKNVVFSDHCKLTSIPNNFLGLCGYGCNGHPGKYNREYYSVERGIWVTEEEFIRDPAQIAANVLETVDFGKNNSLQSIESSVFYNQSHLKSIDFGTSTSEKMWISSGAFTGVGNNAYLVANGVDQTLNDGIETLKLPDNLSSLGSGCFMFARIKNLVFPDNCMLTVLEGGFMQIPGPNGEPNPDPVFTASDCLESVYLGANNGLKYIYSGAFANQTHLKTIDFGKAPNLDNISSGAFAGTRSLTTLDLSETKVKSIKTGAFYASGVTTILLPDTLTTLNEGAFQALTAMTTLQLGADFPLTKLEGGVFSESATLTTVDLLDSQITVITDSLKNNPNLTKVIFPETLQSITWTDPTDDEECPFYGCKNVNSLRFSATDPSGFTFTDGVFQFLNESGVVYVPAEATDENIQAYKTLLTNCGLSFAEGKWTVTRYVPVSGVTLDQTNETLIIGQEMTLTATLTPETASVKDLVWSSSDDSIAAVDQNGKVTAIKAGAAVITVTAPADRLTATCDVTVEYIPVTVKADDKTKTQGYADPEWTAAVTGLEGSDTLQYTFSREAGEQPGTYAITPAGEQYQGKYAVTYASGTLTINAYVPVYVPTDSGNDDKVSTETTTTENADGSVTETTVVQSTVTNADGSRTTGTTTTETTTAADGSVTEKVTESSTTTNKDGSKTEKNSETETTTDADGNVTEKVVETSTTTNKDGSVTETAAESETTTAADGSVTESATETCTTTNKDGSVIETVTESETSTDADGNVTATETVTETETRVESVENGDGTTTAATVTEKTEKTTETATDADGNVTETVTEKTERKNVETTVDADGKTTGSGTLSGSATTTDADGNVSTAVTEGTVAVTTDENGTVTEVTTATTTTTDAQGEVTEDTTITTDSVMTNGNTGTVVENEDGVTIDAEITITEQAIKESKETDKPIVAPATVSIGTTVHINLPSSIQAAGVTKMPRVEIGVKQPGSGIVAFERLLNGLRRLIRECVPGSVIVPVSNSCEIVIEDNTKSFTDVKAESWYSESVTFVTAREIFNGNGDGTFAPGAQMNRAMVAQIIYNLDRNATAGDGSVFRDVEAGKWYNDAIGWAASNGIITGYNGAYNPLKAVTRQDLVTILYRYAQMTGYDVSIGEVDTGAFSDWADVSDYAADAMRWAISKGIINGYQNGTLRPKATTTRAEVAAVMQRLLVSEFK